MLYGAYGVVVTQKLVELLSPVRIRIGTHVKRERRPRADVPRFTRHKYTK